MRIAAVDVSRIRDARLDVLLRFSFGRPEGEILDAARHGVWSFQHGDERRYRGGPPAFWELFDRSSEIGVVLHRLADRPDDERVLHRAVLPVEPHTYAGTLNRVYEGGVDLPLQVCRDLQAGRALPAAGVPARAPLRTLPGSRDVARVLASTVMARLQRLAYGAFVLKQWSIGRLDGGPDRILTGSLAGARWVRPFSRTQMLADPMIVPGSGGRVVLCEALDFAVGQGLIARVEVDDDGSGKAWLTGARLRRLVELPVHLSFPTVVSSADGLVLIPEAATSGGLLTARLDDTATSAVDLESSPGMAAVDPVVFRHDDRWWLACSEQGPTARSHVWMFHGPGPRGPWTAHARNPVVIDAGSARAAGLPFAHGGALYRPAQDGRVGYGRSIRVMRVRTLTPDDYAEDLAAEIGPDPKAPFGLGVHTVSVEGDTIWIDGYRAVMHPLAGWFRVRARRSPAASVGRRVEGWPA